VIMIIDIRLQTCHHWLGFTPSYSP